MLSKLMREPLVRFASLGGILFAVGYSIEQPERPGVVGVESPIVVPPGIAGDPVERERFLDEEVLVRRARELGIDEVDLVVRRRLVQQMRFLIEDARVIAEPDEAALVQWLASDPERYRREARLSFEHIFVSRVRHGDAPEERATALLEDLRRGASSVGVGDPFFGGSRFESVTLREVDRSFGPGFGEQLAPLETGRWSAPLRSSYGVHLVRVLTREEERPSRLEEVRSAVRRDVRQALREVANREALDALRAQYGVEPAAHVSSSREIE